jgi:hypothetical protein
VYFSYYEGASFPELQTGGGLERGRWYNLGMTRPAAMFDGELGPQVTELDSFYPRYRDMIDGARSVPAKLEIRLDTAVTRADSAQVTLGVVVTPTDSAVDTMGNLRLVAVVYEDSVPYVNFAGDTLYARLVARRVLADTWGIPLHLTFGQDFDTTLRTPAAGWRPDRLGAAVFVQDVGTRAVMQSVVRRRLR